MTTKNNEIVFGDIELDDLEFEPRHVKVRVTTMIDEDVLMALRDLAAKKEQKYQTILNDILRAFVEKNVRGNSTRLDEKRVRQIVKEELRKRA